MENNKTTTEKNPRICNDTGFVIYKTIKFTKEDILDLIILQDKNKIFNRGSGLLSTLKIDIISDTFETIEFSLLEISILKEFYLSIILNKNIKSRY